jgi:hypothetical protein
LDGCCAQASPHHRVGAPGWLSDHGLQRERAWGPAGLLQRFNGSAASTHHSQVWCPRLVILDRERGWQPANPDASWADRAWRRVPDDPDATMSVPGQRVGPSFNAVDPNSEFSHLASITLRGIFGLPRHLATAGHCGCASLARILRPTPRWSSYTTAAAALCSSRSAGSRAATARTIPA